MRVCPLFQCRLDKSFRLAIGLWPVWPGSFVPDTKLPACFTKFTGCVAGTVIRQDPLDPYAACRIPGNGGPEKLYGRFRRFIREDCRVGHPRGVINANVQIFPAGTAAINLPGSRLSMSHTVDPAQTFNIQMQHLSGVFPLVTPYRRFYFQRGKP